MTIYVLILAGGAGSRLWPKSRQATPKQFLDLTGSETMIQAAVRRIRPIIPLEQIFVVTGQQYVPLVREQLPLLPTANIIAELSGKNTAPAIGLGALHIAEANPEATMAVLPADHIIQNEMVFREALIAACNMAEKGNLVTLGITPTRPETGYGYIHCGELIGECAHQSIYQAKRFLEKPDLSTAEEFFHSGQYYWNSGMFVWQISTFFEALSRHMPNLFNQLHQLKTALFDHTSSPAVDKIWEQIEPESIDYGLMEKAQNVVVVPLNAGWNDVGSWTALYNELAQTDQENVAINVELLSINSQGLLVQGKGNLIATIGVKNLVIVQTEQALLICKKDQAQAVKTAVDQLKSGQKFQYL